MIKDCKTVRGEVLNRNPNAKILIESGDETFDVLYLLSGSRKQYLLYMMKATRKHKRRTPPTTAGTK